MHTVNVLTTKLEIKIVCKGIPTRRSVASLQMWQTVRWIKMPLGKEVGLSPGHIVLDPAPHSSISPFFGPCLLWPNGRLSQQMLSSCCKAHYCDRPTDHATRSITIGHIYIHSTAKQPKNSVAYKILPERYIYMCVCIYIHCESTKKTSHYNVAHNFAKCWLIVKIPLSCTRSVDAFAKWCWQSFSVESSLWVPRHGKWRRCSSAIMPRFTLWLNQRWLTLAMLKI